MTAQNSTIISRQKAHVVTFFYMCLLFFSLNSWGNDQNLNFVKINSTQPPILKLQKNWIFTGIINNENGENYSYYFKMQFDNFSKSFVITILNNQTREILLFEKNSIPIIAETKQEQSIIPNEMQGAQSTEENKIIRRVGKGFLHFDRVTNSWIFGIDPNFYPNFNFKVDLLSQTAKQQALRPGLNIVVAKTGELNGHLQLAKETPEFFISAKSTWFEQITIEKALSNPLLTCFCQFDDGNSFYAIQLKDIEALQGTLAGWYNSQALPTAVSQFISLTATKNNFWRINLSMPKVNLLLENKLRNKFDSEVGQEKAKKFIIAGFINKIKPGFCTISNDFHGDRDVT